MIQKGRRGALFLSLPVEVFFRQFPNDTLRAMLAVQFGAAALHAPLAHVHVELLAPEAGGKLGMFGALHSID